MNGKHSSDWVLVWDTSTSLLMLPNESQAAELYDAENENVEIERKEIKSDRSEVGVALIKYATYLIIFFGMLWFIITYISPMI